MSISILSLTLMALASQEPKITWSGPAGPANRVLSEVSKSIGTKLVTSMQTQDDLLYVRVKDLPLPRFQELVAKATGNKWIKDSEGLRLVRDGDADKARAAAALEARSRLVSKGLETQPRSRGGNVINPAVLIEAAPGDQAVREIAKGLGAKALASIPNGHRIVFSSQPNRMQRALGSHASPIARALATEVAKSVGKKPDDPTAGFRPITPNNDLGTIQGDLRNGLGKVLLIVRNLNDQLLSLELLVADGQGKTLAMGNSSIDLQSEPDAPLPIQEAKFEPRPETVELSKLLLGAPRVQAAQDVMIMTATVVGSSSGGVPAILGPSGDAMAPVPASLIQRLSKPDQHEPAAFGLTEALDGLGGPENVVAYLPDAAIVPPLRVVQNKSTVAQLWSVLSPLLKVEKGDDALMISPRSIDAARAGRMNRHALTRLLQSIDPEGLVKLMDMATFAAAQGKSPSLNEYDGLILRLFAPGTLAETVSRGGGMSSAWSMLKMLGAMSPAQRQSAAAGNPITVGSLTGSAQAALLEDVFNSWDGPAILPPGGGRTTRSMVVTASDSGMVFAGFGLSLATERTEVLGQGLDPRSTLQVNSQFDTAVVGIDSKSGHRRFLQAQNLASGANFPNVASYDRFRLVASGNYALRFTFGERVNMVRALNDAWIATRTAPVAYDQLPQDFRAKVDQAKNMAGNFRIQFQEGRALPPPP